MIAYYISKLIHVNKRDPSKQHVTATKYIVAIVSIFANCASKYQRLCYCVGSVQIFDQPAQYLLSVSSLSISIDTSASVGVKPTARITSPKSRVAMVPVPSRSNRSNIPRISVDMISTELLVLFVRWTWRFIHMKSIWNHIFITSYEICLNNTRIYYELRTCMYFIWTSYELLMNFICNEIKFNHMKFKNSYELYMEFKWTSHEFHMKLKQIYSYELTCSSYEVHMKFISKN